MLTQLNDIFTSTLRAIFKDSGVLIFCIVVPFAYPLLYAFLYTGETIHEVPAVVIDQCSTPQSREYIRKVNATPDVEIIAHATSLAEGKEFIKHRDAYGIIFIPEEFSKNIARGEQAHVQLYVDMSGLLYYKALLTANTNVSLEMNANIKAERTPGATEEQLKAVEHPIRYQDISIYNPQNGFAGFLIPAVLVLIIQQTLLLGIGMLRGTEHDKLFQEDTDEEELIKLQTHFSRLHPMLRGLDYGFDSLIKGSIGRLGLQRRAFRHLGGVASAFFLVYIPVSMYVLYCVPRIFSLNFIGSIWQTSLFMVPYLISSIFLAQTIGRLCRQRESIILIVVFTSVPLLFISGVSWPGTNIPHFWHYLGTLFPSTWAVNGYVKMTTTGAHLSQVLREYVGLWSLCGVYFLTAMLSYKKR